MRAERQVQSRRRPGRRGAWLLWLVPVLSVLSVLTGAVVAARRVRPALPSAAGSQARPQPQSRPRPQPEPLKPVEPEREPVVGPADHGTGIDQLLRVSGLGRRSAQALVVVGISSLADLADSDVPALGAALDAAGVTRSATLATWPSQAQRLLQG